jgi:hypothetical protein
MALPSQLGQFARLAIGLRGFLRQRVSPDEARAILRRRLDLREDHFLLMVERGVFNHPGSPYRPLFARAGCTFADVRQMVRTRGVEATLRALGDEGVYVTFEEFKGREPLVRGEYQASVTPASFSNPLLAHHYWTETSGSTGARTRVATSFARLADMAPYLVVANDAYGLTGAPRAVWRGMLPAGAGLNALLASTVAGDTTRRWFTPLAAGDLTSSRKYPLATYAIIALGRAYGTRLPWPEHVPIERADTVARWAADAVRTNGRCHVSTSASLALRVCLAAKEHGLDLSGTVFSGGGEPMTPGKARGIRAAGASCRPGYYATETGVLGMSCGNPIEDGDQHLLPDSIALVETRREVPQSSMTVDAFRVTNLLPSASHVMLNVELDDYGILERRACGCAFEAAGFTDHVREIRSFRKLTGEGVTLVASDMARVVDEVLPTTFGGSSLDYQIVEEEDEIGFTRLTLVVSPRVPSLDEPRVIETVLNTLARAGAGADHARATWQQAGTLRISRREPSWTDGGKLLPLHRSTRASERMAAGTAEVR